MKRLCGIGLLTTLAACNGLLDLDRAYVDPSIGAAAAVGGEAGAGPEPATPCERYCQAISEGCTGASAQYTDLEACLVTCPYLPEGAPGDAAGNTLHCRLNYALKAPSEPVTYCTWAGPGGDGMCGSNCDGFCALMTATCTEASTDGPGDYFASYEECLGTCAVVPALGGYSATDESTTGGADIFECRLYHVAAAIYADDPAVHCPHAMGLKLCVDGE